MQSDFPTDELQRLRKGLVEQKLEMRRFIETLVHDVRAHQRGINTSAELLSNELGLQLSAPVTEILGQLQEEVSRMNSLLTAVSRYSDTMSGARYSMRIIPLEASIQFARSELDTVIRETGATVTIAEMPRVEGDPARLASVFQNLISNAISYRSAAQPKVEIQAKPQSDRWVVSVQDNGIGISPEYWDRLFVPFFRLHGPERSGSGLGLATCKNIVEAHGGTIWLASRVCEGTTFFFTLPRLVDQE